MKLPSFLKFHKEAKPITAKHRHPLNLRRMRGEKDIKKWTDDTEASFFEELKA